MITKSKDPKAPSLGWNDDKVANLIDGKPKDILKCTKTTHAPNVESNNDDQSAIKKSTRVMRLFINHVCYLMKVLIGDGNCMLHTLAFSS